MTALGADENEIAEFGWLGVDVRMAAFGHATPDGGVGEDLRARADVAPSADLEAAESIDERERTDPRAFSDRGVTRDPGERVVRIGRKRLGGGKVHAH